jgi:hypothetical protein
MAHAARARQVHLHAQAGMHNAARRRARHRHGSDCMRK